MSGNSDDGSRTRPIVRAVGAASGFDAAGSATRSSRCRLRWCVRTFAESTATPRASGNYVMRSASSRPKPWAVLRAQNPMGGERRKQRSWTGSAQDAVSPPVRQRWEALDLELIEAEMQVSHLNRVYAALLRRAQRTLRIFIRLRASSANTYTPPKGARAPSPLQEASHV